MRRATQRCASTSGRAWSRAALGAGLAALVAGGSRAAAEPAAAPPYESLLWWQPLPAAASPPAAAGAASALRAAVARGEIPLPPGAAVRVNCVDDAIFVQIDTLGPVEPAAIARALFGRLPDRPPLAPLGLAALEGALARIPDPAALWGPGTRSPRRLRWPVGGALGSAVAGPAADPPPTPPDGAPAVRGPAAGGPSVGEQGVGDQGVGERWVGEQWVGGQWVGVQVDGAPLLRITAVVPIADASAAELRRLAAGGRGPGGGLGAALQAAGAPAWTWSAAVGGHGALVLSASAAPEHALALVAAVEASAAAAQRPTGAGLAALAAEEAALDAAFTALDPAAALWSARPRTHRPGPSAAPRLLLVGDLDAAPVDLRADPRWPERRWTPARLEARLRRAPGLGCAPP